MKTTLKFAVAFLLIYWLVHSGKLEFGLLKRSFQNPEGWIVCLGLMICNLFMQSFRWKMIVETSSKENIGYFNYVKLTWIGLLFNSVLPGAVSGDFVKLVYANNIDKKLSKTFLLISVFMDRILGLIGLITISGIFSALAFNELSRLSPIVEKILYFNFLLFLGSVVFLLCILLPEKRQKIILGTFENIPFFGKYINKILMQTWIIGRYKRVVFTSLLISVCGQGMLVAAFWFLTKPFYNNPISLYHAYSFVPIGQISVAIPITPAGLGLGHVVFDRLFSFYNVSKGASLFNLFWLANISMNCLGLFPYVFGNIKVSKQEINQFKSAE